MGVKIEANGIVYVVENSRTTEHTETELKELVTMTNDFLERVELYTEAIECSNSNKATMIMEILEDIFNLEIVEENSWDEIINID